ncbi:hypothetical protein KEM52_000479 [Ascosphaera acerosa]|nr:hypothetical protein KEM52_000479 [Ascosphaera acerosa]
MRGHRHRHEDWLEVVTHSRVQRAHTIPSSTSRPIDAFIWQAQYFILDSLAVIRRLRLWSGRGAFVRFIPRAATLISPATLNWAPPVLQLVTATLLLRVDHPNTPHTNINWHDRGLFEGRPQPLPRQYQPVRPNVMHFAPYHTHSPDVERALSPPHARRSLSLSPSPSPPPPRLSADRSRHPHTAWRAPGAHAPASRWHGYQDLERGLLASTSTRNHPRNDDAGSTYPFGHLPAHTRRPGLEAFETSLPVRIDFEAGLAYLLVPPAGSLFLLLFERKSDYIRFHAWQSSMLFSMLWVSR